MRRSKTRTLYGKGMSVQLFDQTGFSVVPSVLEQAECDHLLSLVAEAGCTAAGTRNILRLPWCKELALALKVRGSLANLLSPNSVAVQCTLFEKSPEKNWLVTLHQDLSIPVLEKISPPDCSGWSEKEGVIYTQPPIAVLEQLVAVRVHLDKCGPENGPLRVVPESHRLGRLADSDIAKERNRLVEIECHVPKAGALVMRPLLLHASSKARSPTFRRVLHFLFGPPMLPFGLRWNYAV